MQIAWAAEVSLSKFHNTVTFFMRRQASTNYEPSSLSILDQRHDTVKIGQILHEILPKDSSKW